MENEKTDLPRAAVRVSYTRLPFAREEEEIGGIYQAGDCYAPRLIADAVFEGHRIAREFESDNPQRPLPFLRERMIWGRDNIAGAPN